MKEYDRESKSWLTEEEVTNVKKKREKCRGGREHDYVQVLPYGVEALPNYSGNAEAYYDTQLAIAEFTEKQYQKLQEEHGIKTRTGYIQNLRTSYRTAMCSVCHKKKYKSA